MWRDATTVQIGTTPDRALVIGGLGPIEAAVLRALDGHNTLPTLRDLATAAGGDPQIADRIVDMLVSAGAAVDGEYVTADSNGLPAESTPDRASLGLVDRSTDGGHATFTRRGRKRVEVIGAGRIGATVARLLAAGGIGDVGVDDEALVDAADVAPGGHPAAHVGLPRGRSLGSILPRRPRRGSPSEAQPDFVVLAPTKAAEHQAVATSLLHADVPHLLVHVVEIAGLVGPLVVPGSSACLRCLDLHRTDRDRDWPTVLDRIARTSPRTPPCDTSLATTVAGLAAGHVLAFLDGYDVASINGTITVELPYGLPRRKSWRPHPECDCGGADAAQ
ncbi:TOMM precursor leader peptide-binding protein [Phytoactinopolyspora limicola]|uniref:TOMM precursor leader peptide-binding protein n=1 Tax=Phytoactinopolyspora limicola TaxID=2715536 RepID=UPI00140C7173|nr:TOMM precursor leader peptide-binding protein [Phytoactinopolyspora limicola]